MKEITLAEAAGHIKDGMTLMVGGFLACGAPEPLIDAVAEKGVRNLTIIANDGGFPDKATGKLIKAGLVKKLITSHIGMNPSVAVKMNAGEIEVELVPQGTLAERIRAGGAGLGGVLTPTGVGTAAAEGKEIIVVDGREFLLEKPLRAEAALIYGSIADEDGNVFYSGTTRNFNPLMAAAADLVICCCEKIVPVGEIEGENVVTPGIFVDYIVGGGDGR